MSHPPSPPDCNAWNGLSFLATIRGDTRTYPPLRVLFLASRLHASGLMTVETREGKTGLFLQKGRISQITGVPGILSVLGPGLSKPSDLAGALMAAIRAGYLTDRVFEAAHQQCVKLFSEWVDLEDGSIAFEDGVQSPPGTFPLDWALPQMIFEAVRSSRGLERTITRMERSGSASVTLFLPTDSPEERWGLDPLSLRVLHLASTPSNLQDLITSATGANPARRRGILLRLYVLEHLGLVRINYPSEVSDRGPTPSRVLRVPAETEPLQSTIEANHRGSIRTTENTPPAVGTPIKGAAMDRAPVQEGSQLSMLSDAAIRLKQQNYLERLELTNATQKPSQEELDAAFRDVSRRFHPDRFVGAPPDIVRLAAECFSLINEAHEALLHPDILAEHWRRLQCEKKGIPFVCSEDATRARIAFKKAEMQFRLREYAVAEACLAEAMRLDPTVPAYVEKHAFSAYLARQMSAEEAIKRLDGISPNDPVSRAAAEMTAARILQLEGAPDSKVLERVQAALKLDPQNRDAQREMRLREMRRMKNSATGRFGFLDRLRRKEEEGGSR